MEPSATDAVKTGLTMANCAKHIKENRLEYLVLSLVLYSFGAIDKGMQYVGQCV